MDQLDVAILKELQRDGRQSNASLAERVGLSDAPCWRRVKKLEGEGILLGVAAVLDRKNVGLDVWAFVSVRFSTHDLSIAAAFEEKMAKEHLVISCHNVTGDVDYILQVAAHDLDEYYQFTVSLRATPGVTSILTSLSLKEVKPAGPFPLRSR